MSTFVICVADNKYGISFEFLAIWHLSRLLYLKFWNYEIIGVHNFVFVLRGLVKPNLKIIGCRHYFILMALLVRIALLKLFLSSLYLFIYPSFHNNIDNISLIIFYRSSRFLSIFVCHIFENFQELLFF